MHLQQSSAVSCVIDWFGPTDFLHWGAGSGINKSDNKDDAVTRLLGGPVPKHLESAWKGSPITWVSKDSSPILIMHGDNLRQPVARVSCRILLPSIAQALKRGVFGGSGASVLVDAPQDHEKNFHGLHDCSCQDQKKCENPAVSVVQNVTRS